MIVFDGNQAAKEIELQLKTRVAQFKDQGSITIVAILFLEDTGSQLYTSLKRSAAERIGIEYLVESFSLKDESARVVSAIDRANRNWAVTGVIVQKPSKKVWQRVTGRPAEQYTFWWNSIMSAVAPEKDVDGLHPTTLQAVEAGTWQELGRVLPATCKAVLYVLAIAQQRLVLGGLGKTIILGKSDLLGRPLYAVLNQQSVDVELLDSASYNIRKEQKIGLTDATTIISATGQPGLLTAEDVTADCILIDVGEPQADITPDAYQKAAFVSPSPGGVGPLTVVFLMQNAIELAQFQTEQQKSLK